jgi:hypothetical protein
MKRLCAVIYAFIFRRLTEVDADIFNGKSFAGSHLIIKEFSYHVADSVAVTWGLKREAIEIYAYSLDDKNQLDRLLEEGYDCLTSKGERVVVDYKRNTVKKFKGEKLNIWESRLITLLRKGMQTS